MLNMPLFIMAMQKSNGEIRINIDNIASLSANYYIIYFCFIDVVKVKASNKRGDYYEIKIKEIIVSSINMRNINIRQH